MRSDYERFQLKVAGALARWQAVELRVREFFVRVIESPDTRWAAAAFYSAGTFRSQLEMLHEILLYRLPSEALVKEWLKLKKKLTDQSSNRNKVVHWTFVATFTEADKKNYTHVSMPLGDARHAKTGKQLTETDLEKMATDFGILQNLILEFHQRVEPVLVSPEKFSLPTRE